MVGGCLGWRFGVLFCAAVAIVLRAPHLFTEPRFYCEEALEYFVAPQLHGWPEWLFWPHQGYYSLVPNFACAAAWLVPLEMAPVVTTWVAFGVQLLPIAIVLWSKAPLWSSVQARVASVAALLVCYGTGETWLSTIMAQYYLGVAAALIYLDDDTAAERARRWFLRGVLLLGGLTGVLSCFLLPLFAWRALRRRHGEPIVHAAILTLCVVVQGIAALSYSSLPENIANATLGSRVEIPSLVAITAALANNVFLTNVLGEHTAARVVSDLATRPLAEGLSSSVFALLVFVPLAALLTFLGWGKQRLPILGAFAAVFLVTLSVTMGSKLGVLVPGGGARYYLIPSALFLVLLATCLAQPTSRIGQARRIVAALLIGCALLHGFIGYRSVVPDFREWSNWRNEVEQWREQPYHRLHIWPATLTMAMPSETSTTASIQPLGESRGSQGPTQTVLSVSAPRLGSPSRVEIRGARASISGHILIDEGTASPPQLVTGIDRGLLYTAHGLQSPHRIPFTTDATGAWAMDLPLANDRTFVGYIFTVQAVFNDPVDEVTNALLLQLGR